MFLIIAGPANVSSFFLPRKDAENTDGQIASFRGRALRGSSLILPEHYTGMSLCIFMKSYYASRLRIIIFRLFWRQDWRFVERANVFAERILWMNARLSGNLLVSPIGIMTLGRRETTLRRDLWSGSQYPRSCMELGLPPRLERGSD